MYTSKHTNKHIHTHPSSMCNAKRKQKQKNEFRYIREEDIEFNTYGKGNIQVFI